MKIIYLISIIFYAIVYIDVSLSAVLYWFDTTSDRNPDFDKDSVPENTLVKGDVILPINNEGFPTPLKYIYGDNPTYSEDGSTILINNEQTLENWVGGFDPDWSIAGEQDFNFSNYYEVSEFFPIDGKGFGNDGDIHNFKWCAWISFKSQVIGDEFGVKMDIIHTDDLFVFQDGNLIASSVGIIDVQMKDIKLEEPAYENSQSYIDIITCNRKKRPNQYFEILTNIALDCQYFDSCGVCNGNNDCLCSPFNCDAYNELNCSSGVCIDEYTCEHSPLECNNVYATKCLHYECIRGSGCRLMTVYCNDLDPCTIDTCDDFIGCIYTPIENCIPCSSTTNCITTDQCNPQECVPDDPNQCITIPKNCTVLDDECILGYCENGECLFESICSSEDPTTTTTTTTITTAPVTISHPTILSTIISSITTSLATTLPSTGIDSTTISQTTLPVSSLPTITGSSISSTIISSIISSTISSTTSSNPITSTSSSIETSISTVSTTLNPILTKCNSLSCPHHYCCIQLSFDSYTCVSNYFDENCLVDRLKLFK